MISRATMNLKPVVIELDGGPIWKCPLWVKSRHLQCTPSCLLYPRKRTCAAHYSMSALCQ